MQPFYRAHQTVTFTTSTYSPISLQSSKYPNFNDVLVHSSINAKESFIEKDYTIKKGYVRINIL